MTLRTIAVLLAFAYLSAQFAGHAQGKQPDEKAADYALAPVTVTADKAEQDLRDVPASISVTTGDQLEDYNVVDTFDLFRRTPNMHIVQLGSKGAQSGIATIRGIGNFMSGEPVVGFFVDDVYQANMQMDLVDVDRVEVLRGPQGTLYGKNTEAGLIHVITKQPENEWNFTSKVDAGNYNTKSLTASAGGAVVEDRVFLRAAGLIRDSDGWFTNKNDDDKPGETRDVNFRTNLRLLPTDDWDITLTADVQKYFGNYAELAPMDDVERNPNEVDVDWLGRADTVDKGLSLRAIYGFGDMKLTSITAARAHSKDTSNDLDFTPANVSRLYIVNEDQQLSQEFRLQSDIADAPFKWLAGTYLADDTNDFDTDMKQMGMFTAKRNSTTETTTMALFGQTSYLFANNIEVTTGLRFNHEEREFEYDWSGLAAFGTPDSSGSTDKDFDAWLPKLAVGYKGFDHVMPYVSAAKGYKSGGFNTQNEPGKPYDAEFTWSYEAGTKTHWFDNRLELNLAAFLIKWEDMQVLVPAFPDFSVENAAKATSTGLEMELRARPLRRLELTGALGYTRAVFDEYQKGDRELSGMNAPNVPEFSAQFGGTYRFDDGLFLGTDYTRTGRVYQDAENAKALDAYQAVSARLGYEAENWDVSLWGKNILGEEYITRAFTMNGVWYARAGDPRTFGVSARIRF